MRELQVGNQSVRVRANSLTLLFYKQEFRSDLMGDLLKMEKLMDDLSQFDSLSILQMIWAMAKSDAFGRGSFPPFETWLASIEDIDLADTDMMLGAMEEAQQGLFRKGFKGAVK